MLETRSWAAVVEIKVECPVCSQVIVTDIREAQVKYSLRNPVPIVLTHGDPEHAITAFVDKEFRVRAVSGVNIVQRIQEAESRRRPLEKRFVPFPKENVDLKGIDSFQLKIMALVDGRRSVKELAEILNAPEMRVKIVCEQLVRMGKLDSVKVVVE